MPDNQIIIDKVNATASLTLFVEGIEVTSYVYDNGVVTLSERISDVDVPINELIINVDDIRDFIKLIERKLNPVISKEEFWYRLEYENSKDKCKMESNSNVIINATYQNGIAMFKARPEIEIPFFVFKKFLACLDRFIQEILIA